MQRKRVLRLFEEKALEKTKAQSCIRSDDASTSADYFFHYFFCVGNPGMSLQRTNVSPNAPTQTDCTAI